MDGTKTEILGKVESPTEVSDSFLAKLNDGIRSGIIIGSIGELAIGWVSQDPTLMAVGATLALAVPGALVNLGAEQN